MTLPRPRGCVAASRSRRRILARALGPGRGTFDPDNDELSLLGWGMKSADPRQASRPHRGADRPWTPRFGSTSAPGARGE